MKKFRLTIDLGNDALQDAQGVVAILDELSTRLGVYGFEGDVVGTVRDVNGNTVGHWELDE